MNYKPAALDRLASDIVAEHSRNFGRKAARMNSQVVAPYSRKVQPATGSTTCKHDLFL